MESWGCYKCKRAFTMDVPYTTTRGGHFKCVGEKECEAARRKKKKAHEPRAIRAYLAAPGEELSGNKFHMAELIFLRHDLHSIKILKSRFTAVGEWVARFHHESALLAKKPELLSPIPMILHCPECRARHVDEGVYATKIHATHACQSCGFVWRPAVVPTVGVKFLPGFKNDLYACPCGGKKCTREVCYGPEAQLECDHGVTFDQEAAAGLDAYEVRKRWPRLDGECPKGCGFNGIGYASYMHYLSGDW